MPTSQYECVCNMKLKITKLNNHSLSSTCIKKVLLELSNSS